MLFRRRDQDHDGLEVRPLGRGHPGVGPDPKNGLILGAVEGHDDPEPVEEEAKPEADISSKTTILKRDPDLHWSFHRKSSRQFIS